MASGRRQYPFHLIEPRWQRAWDEQQSFRAFNPGEEIPAGHPFAKRHGLSGRVTAEQLPPKFYVLDMFPYPSGAGLHVGHPEGYTATDILARFRRAQGRHVLHPMGWDAFGLPAEQYAVKTGQHPRLTTEQNVATFKRQINSLGFSYDWSREVNTTEPGYFKWTQWIFLQLYNSWFNPRTNKAEPIETLEYPGELRDDGRSRREEAQESAESKGQSLLASAPTDLEARRRAYRDSKRLAFVSEAPVWWCEALGTVLANEEVVDGKSEVGGHPVTRKPMRQWMLRITEYAERLLADLDTIDWSHSLKEMQRNWIGRSEGAEVDFEIADCGLPNAERRIRVFTTRPDTLFGATYMVLAPEHRLIDRIYAMADCWSAFEARINEQITAESVCVIFPDGKQRVLGVGEALAVAKAEFKDLIEVAPAASPPICRIGGYDMFRMTLRQRAEEILAQRNSVEGYRREVAKKSDLERTELAKEKTGVFTGAYAVNPVHGGQIPIWIADYVLASYGTGAIMAVPGHDTRDFEFAEKFGLPIVQVVQPPDEKTDWRGFTDPGTAVNSVNEDISLDGLPTAEAKAKITAWLESKGLGKKTVNYKLRDWLFSRQRYWGEPFPIVWKKDADGSEHHEALPESALPVVPPPLDDYKPTATGEPPLARAGDWVNLPDGSRRETNTMPQWAGSCWYYLRYLDAANGGAFVSREAEAYWMGTAGDEAMKRESVKTSADPSASTFQRFIAATKPGVDLYVGGTEHAVLHLLYARFWHKVLFDLGHVSTAEPFYKLVNQGIILGEDGQKMSKSRGNVVNPDDILKEFGADAFRLYEMFMGPLEMMKPWNTQGVEGVYRFLGRVWRLFVDEASAQEFEQNCAADPGRADAHLAGVKLSRDVQVVAATPAQLKTLHATIKKVTEDLEHFRFNTAISAMMVFVNEAMTWPVKPAAALADFLILLQPFAPHLVEELWARLMGHAPAAVPQPDLALPYQPWPAFDAALLVEDELEIPVQVNGKLRDRIRVSATATNAEIERAARAAEKALPFLEGRQIVKVVVVPKKLVNIAVK